ncbi:MAG: NADH-quinone oxidoreductase subunit J [Myxococcales bacterium]|nr:NADH-quinone oxidoreductase subunit J [Myxococcales bacterium]
MTDAKFLLFFFCAAIALAGAIGTIASKLPLRAAMSLLVTIIALAGLYLTLDAQLLAAIQVLVYAGAVVVLFVFVIMLIGPAPETSSAPGSVVWRMLSLVGIAMITATFAFSFVDVASTWVAPPAGFGTVRGVAGEMYTKALVPFEIVAMTLTTAIVGALAIARSKTASELAEMKRRRVAEDASAAAQPAE